MIPIRDLLSRIRSDPELRCSKFEIGYRDRIARRIARVPLDRVEFAGGTRLAFDALEEDGAVHTVPLHRVRAVWRDGTLIWERAVPPVPTEAAR